MLWMLSSREEEMGKTRTDFYPPMQTLFVSYGFPGFLRFPHSQDLQEHPADCTGEVRQGEGSVFHEALLYIHA